MNEHQKATQVMKEKLIPEDYNKLLNYILYGDKEDFLQTKELQINNSKDKEDKKDKLDNKFFKLYGF